MGWCNNQNLQVKLEAIWMKQQHWELLPVSLKHRKAQEGRGVEVHCFLPILTSLSFSCCAFCKAYLQEICCFSRCAFCKEYLQEICSSSSRQPKTVKTAKTAFRWRCNPLDHSKQERECQWSVNLQQQFLEIFAWMRFAGVADEISKKGC